MATKTIADINVKGKRVLMRVDFNVPLDGSRITDDRRIVQALSTIKAVLDQGGRLILMSHLGRPKGGPEAKYSLKPCQARLSELLGKPVKFADDCVGLTAETAANSLRDGEVLLLENVRFHKEEEKNDPNFAKQLAKLGDAYINDAFGTAHREHASTFGVPQAMQGKPRVIGFLIQKELKFLGDAVTNPQRPFVSILGGAKVSDKILVIKNLLPKCDTLLIGGAMAYTFFLAQGKTIGKSLVEPDQVDLARELINQSGKGGVVVGEKGVMVSSKGVVVAQNARIVLPVDTVVAAGFDSTQTQVVEGNIPGDLSGFDIGPKTRDIFKAEIAKAKTILWNGPMGVFEKPQFAEGTRQIAQAVADATQKNYATSIIGGGDSAAAIEQLHLSDKVSHVSTGGGASLEFLENGHFSTLDILD